MAKIAQRKRRTAVKCIFCGENADSGEHLISNWLREHLPTKRRNHHTYKDPRIEFAGGNILSSPTSKIQGGPLHAHKVRCVCRDCNNGWMNRIETAARPALTGILTTSLTRISPMDQEAVAVWAMLKTMVGEFDGAHDVGISDFDRRQFYVDRIMPRNTRIWLGRYQAGAGESDYHHACYGIYPRAAVLFDRNLPANTQVTNLAFGNIFLHIRTSSFSQIELDNLDGYRDRLAKIWPPVDDAIDWPPPKPMRRLMGYKLGNDDLRSCRRDDVS